MCVTCILGIGDSKSLADLRSVQNSGNTTCNATPCMVMRTDVHSVALALKVFVKKKRQSSNHTGSLRMHVECA